LVFKKQQFSTLSGPEIGNFPRVTHQTKGLMLLAQQQVSDLVSHKIAEYRRERRIGRPRCASNSVVEYRSHIAKLPSFSVQGRPTGRRMPGDTIR
jgi:hypothetical protein